MATYFVEKWPYSYESLSGRIKTTALNLWQYDDKCITKVAEYIVWPFANAEDPNVWARTGEVIRTPVKNNGKYYKTHRFFLDNMPFETLDSYPEAKESLEKHGIIDYA